MTKQSRLQASMEKDTLKKLQKKEKQLAEKRKKVNLIIEGNGPENLSVKKIQIMIGGKEKEVRDFTELFQAGAVSLAQLEDVQNDLEQLKSDLEIQESRGISEEVNYSTTLSDLEGEIISVKQDRKNQEKLAQVAKERWEQSLKSIESSKANFLEKITGLIKENDNRIENQKSEMDIQIVAYDSQELLSPVDGKVKTLEVNTVGGVVIAAQTVATVVPENSELIVETDILNQDIGFIDVGQSVAIKLDSFNFQKYGKLDGKVIYVSPDAIQDEKKGWIYKAKIIIDKEEFERKIDGMEIAVGMECTSEIDIGERRIIDFFLEPVLEHFDSSLKVR